jgi:hypothetical protein
MPKYTVTTYIIEDYTAGYEAENEQEARDMAYAEVECDIPDDGYVTHTCSLIRE